MVSFPSPDQLRTLGKLVALPVAGAIAMQLWSRYRARMANIRWTQRTTPLAFATEDTGWGEVEVLYDGNPARGLHMCNVEIQNASSRDLSAVVVTIVASDGTIALRGGGRLRGGPTQFPATDAYNNAVKRLSDGELSEPETAQLMPRLEFLVPVLNRGSIADLTVLLSREDHTTPTVSLSIEHVGVRVTHEDLETLTWGVRDGQASLTGLLLSFALTVAAVRLSWAPWIVASVAWLSAILCIYTGAIVVQAWRRIAALAD